MATKSAPRLRILSVGGNAVSAFLSWRLQATNACDVTLVWKNGFESVNQYGISFKSARFGNERFKPRSVVRSPEEAAHVQRGDFDYVLLCVKALPDVYDLAAVIEPVVTPQHTCILINTSHSLGVESLLEERFPKNVVLSLVSEADITQLGPSEFEHQGGSELWVGPANRNSEIPNSIQGDMAEALAMTLGLGHVDCKVSKNIQQQQFERMMGPIAFHTCSVLFETPNHAEMLDLPGVRALVSEAIDEIISTAEARQCLYPANTKDKIMEEMILPKHMNSIMYQDYCAKRPMEIETYLGAPVQLAKKAGVKTPRLETLYAMLHHVNIANQKRSAPPVDSIPIANGGTGPSSAPRMSSAPPPHGPLPNGSYGVPMRGSPMGVGPPGRGGRAPSMNGPPRRMYSGMNGHHPGMNGMLPPRGPQGQLQQRPSYDNGLDQSSHLVLLDEAPADGFTDGSYGTENGNVPQGDLALRERELMLRQKEMALREREFSMRNRGPRPPPSQAGGWDEEEEGDDYFDPMAYRGPPVDPDNVDMMSITSRRTRKQPSNGQLRSNPEMMAQSQRRSAAYGGRPNAQKRVSSRLTNDFPGLHESIMDDPLMGYSSDRYGDVDRKAIGRESRTNSLTAARMSEMAGGPGASYGAFPPMARRTSQSPGNPLSAGPRQVGPPQHGYMPANHNGLPPNGRPSPPDMRQPVPRHPPGHGNAVAPQEVEQRAGVSSLYPPKSAPVIRSLTGSASASAGSGDSGRSAPVDSGNSAYSSQSSLGPRPPIGVR